MGSKADLHKHRQVTSDLARLSLHTWFPPPKPPSPPPPPPPSTFSYIRPRFTSFPSIRSAPATTPATKPASSPLETEPRIDPRTSALKRSHTSALTRPRAQSGGLGARTTTWNSSAIRPLPSRYESQFGYGNGGWNELADGSSNSLNEDEEDEMDESDGQEWGLNKGMELFEVSAKDDVGQYHSTTPITGCINLLTHTRNRCSASLRHIDRSYNHKKGQY